MSDQSEYSENGGESNFWDEFEYLLEDLWVGDPPKFDEE